MEVPSESFHRSSWDSRTCYARRAFNRGLTDDLWAARRASQPCVDLAFILVIVSSCDPHIDGWKERFIPKRILSSFSISLTYSTCLLLLRAVEERTILSWKKHSRCIDGWVCWVEGCIVCWVTGQSCFACSFLLSLSTVFVWIATGMRWRMNREDKRGLKDEDILDITIIARHEATAKSCSVPGG